jgi:hypothetical protein
MTATRFTLMNPDRVTHLVLEDPLGLADYRIGIPPQSEDKLYQHELHWTDPAVLRAYVAAYFVHPDPNVYGPLADVLVRVALGPDYPRRARAAALAFQMIYQQPGWANAMRHMLTGDHWDAQTAYRMGTIAEIAPDKDAALKTGIDIADRIAGCGPIGIKATL